MTDTDTGRDAAASASPDDRSPPAAPVPAPRPGRDEITLTAPDRQQLCHDRQHSKASRAAAVIVTFGKLADPGSGSYSPDALWPQSWGLSFPMCGPCWDTARQVAERARPDLIIRDMT